MEMARISVTIISENSPLVRSVYLNKASHGDAVQPSWNGHSIGHWEGKTLVIDTLLPANPGRFSWGGHLGAQSLAAAINNDVVVVSEGREFDAFEFFRDCNELGIKKGLIMHAHEQGEEYGMQVAESWVASIAPEVPVRYLPSGEPFWIPERRA